MYVCNIFVYFLRHEKTDGFTRLWRAIVEHFPTVNVTLLVTRICTHEHALLFSISPLFYSPIHRPGANWIFSSSCVPCIEISSRGTKRKMRNVNVHQN